MISVDEALDQVFALVGPLGAECVKVREAAGRWPEGAIVARHDQPPFPSSAMDGYAVAAAEPGARLAVIGESAAGRGFPGRVGEGEAVRVFTGAPVPEGASRIVIQEDANREGETIRLRGGLEAKAHIRPSGLDFTAGDRFEPRRPLRPADIALIAAMGHGEVMVRRRPDVAIIATGDELVAPGETPGPAQITASNHLGLAAMIEAAGGTARLLPIARDDQAALATAFDLATGADLLVTIGGASVGDHDLVAGAAAARGLERSFHKVAMRPGKPLMAGRLDGMPMIGLPGNPVSSLVCGAIFILPALRVMLGLPAERAPRRSERLAAPLPPNGPREHYMRARRDENGLTAMDSQDSSRLRLLAEADALIVRPPGDGTRDAGETVAAVPL